MFIHTDIALGKRRIYAETKKKRESQEEAECHRHLLKSLKTSRGKI